MQQGLGALGNGSVPVTQVVHYQRGDDHVEGLGEAKPSPPARSAWKTSALVPRRWRASSTIAGLTSMAFSLAPCSTSHSMSGPAPQPISSTRRSRASSTMAIRSRREGTVGVGGRVERRHGVILSCGPLTILGGGAEVGSASGPSRIRVRDACHQCCCRGDRDSSWSVHGNLLCSATPRCPAPSPAER